jgi:hypothetical protein
VVAWALAYELGDSSVRDRGIVEELFALLQTPVANRGVVYRSNLFRNCIGYTMLRLKCGQEGLLLLASRFLLRQGRTDELPFQEHGTGRRHTERKGTSIETLSCK